MNFLGFFSAISPSLNNDIDDDDDVLKKMMKIPMIGLGLGVVVIPNISWIFPTRIPIAMSLTRPRSSTL